MLDNNPKELIQTALDIVNQYDYDDKNRFIPMLLDAALTFFETYSSNCTRNCVIQNTLEDIMNEIASEYGIYIDYC